MRCLLLWMMMCLLPLRLWAGDAMALQLASTPAHAAAALAAPETHPCHGQAAEDPARLYNADGAMDPTSDSEAAKEHGAACGDCSVCHGALAGVPPLPWLPRALPTAVPHGMGWSASSASALPHLKPPRA